MKILKIFFIIILVFSLGLNIFFLYREERNKGPIVVRENDSKEEVLSVDDNVVIKEKQREIAVSGYSSAKVLRVLSMSMDEFKNYTRDVTFDISINNKLLKEGIKTVGIVSCEYTYDGKSLFYMFGGSTITLEKMIVYNHSGSINMGTQQFTSKSTCRYDSKGLRKCLNYDNTITINSCTILYSSSDDDRHLEGIKPFFQITTDEYNDYKFGIDGINEASDVLEIIPINKSMKITNN